MAHRGGDRDRDRERDRDTGRDRDQARDWERDRPRGERDRRDPARDRGNREPTGLNEFFVDGEGIHRDVMQREICKYLGPEAYSRPGVYNGVTGYIVTAVRPFTPQMIDDLQMLSEAWVSENRDLSRRGYEGVPYPQSQASRRSDRADPPLPSSLDTYIDNRYPPQPSSYTTSSVNPSYTSTSGYPAPPPNYPTPQVSGYPSSGYAPVPGVYQQNAPYPQAPVYQTGSGYPSSSGYSAPVYPAPVGRTANPNDQNYTYDTGEYSTPGYQYRQQGAYPTGAPPRDPRADPRADPRSGPNPNYPYVSSPQDATMRGTAMDERYAYGQSMPTSQAGRGGFPTPARGTPTGGYDPPQPRDGFERETERRRR